MLKIKEKYDPELVKIISINVLNKAGRVEAEVKKYKMDYTVLVGRGHKITSKYKIRKLPHLLILDQHGKIHTSKRFLKKEKIMEALDELLANDTMTESGR